MERAFAPAKDLVGSVYELLHDAAQKAWSLARPVFFVGLLVDFVTARLGWIDTVMRYYRDFISATSGGSTLVVVLLAILAYTYLGHRR